MKTPLLLLVSVCLIGFFVQPIALEAQCPTLFYDGFESGNWTPTWSAAGGTYTRSVITTAPAVGNYCFSQTGSGSHYQGTMVTFPTSTPPSISYWVKTSTTTAASAYVILGDANTTSNQGVLFAYFTSAGMYRIYSGSFGDFNIPATPNTWIHVELRNINYTSKTFDIWINGALAQANFAFRSQSSVNVDRIFLYNFSASTGYYDDISVGGVSLNVTASPTDVLCFGDSSGTATATAVGGLAPYTYTWNNGGNTMTLPAVPTGNYLVTVTDNQGCVGTASTTVGTASAIVSTVTSSDVLCHGDSTGATSVTVSGGTPGYSYLWSNGDTSMNPLALPAGSYAVTVTDGNACTRVDSGLVTEPTALVLTPQLTPPSCNGLSDGAILMVPSGGTPGYSFTWNTGATTSGLTGLMAGSYTVFVSDSNGCSEGSILQLTEPAAIIATTTPTDVSCNGSSDGSIDLSVTGGSPGYSYLWSNGSTTQDLTNLAGGPYTVAVTDSNGCTVTDSVNINEPSAITHSATILDDTGPGNGAINLSPSGGTAPYTFLWSNGATTEDVTGLTAGAYMVTITDSQGCFTTVNFNVNLVVGVAASFGGPNVAVAPNPTGGRITVTLENLEEKVSLTLFDLRGQLLQNIPLTPDGTSVVQLDLSSLPDGLYLLQVVSGEFKISTRVMKQ